MSYDDSSVGIDRRQYYSSSQGPFHDAGNVLTFFGGGGRGEIVEDIVRTRRTARGVVHVHGESGSGRTFLSLVLADRLRHVCNVIRHEPVEPSQAVLLRHLLIELCPMEADLIDAAAVINGVDPITLAVATERVLAQLRRAPPGGKPYLLLVDAAGDIDDDPGALALLERLAAVRRGGLPAMHVVLFRLAGADAVREACARPPESGARHHWLRRLTLAEIGDYLRHQMLLFDFSRRDLFTREMIYFVADRSAGVFRSIDTLARNAFTLASLEDDERPSMAHLLAAGLPARDENVRSASFLTRHRGTCVALLCAGVVASSAALVLLAG